MNGPAEEVSDDIVFDGEGEHHWEWSAPFHHTLLSILTSWRKLCYSPYIETVGRLDLRGNCQEVVHDKEVTHVSSDAASSTPSDYKPAG